MTTNDNKSYLSYLSKLVDQYNNTYHHSVNKKRINADFSGLTEKVETNLKASKFKVNDRVRITKHKNIFNYLSLDLQNQRLKRKKNNREFLWKRIVIE